MIAEGLSQRMAGDVPAQPQRLYSLLYDVPRLYAAYRLLAGIWRILKVMCYVFYGMEYIANYGGALSFPNTTQPLPLNTGSTVLFIPIVRQALHDLHLPTIHPVN